MNADYPDWGFDPQSPFGFEVASRADWRKVFADRPGKLFTEYRDEIEVPIAWLDALQPPDAEKIAWENSQRGGLPSYHAERELRDPEGFHFGAYEFS